MRYIGYIENDIPLFESKKKIVVYGAGGLLDKLFIKLDSLGITNRIFSICDKNEDKWGMFIQGIEIMPLEKTIDRKMDFEYIVYNRYRLEIARYLVEQRIENIHLIRM